MLTAVGLTPIHTDAYDTYKGLKDTLPIKRFLDELRSISPATAAFVENAPAPIRALCGHMAVVIARKP